MLRLTTTPAKLSLPACTSIGVVAAVWGVTLFSAAAWGDDPSFRPFPREQISSPQEAASRLFGLEIPLPKIETPEQTQALTESLEELSQAIPEPLRPAFRDMVQKQLEAQARREDPDTAESRRPESRAPAPPGARPQTSPGSAGVNAPRPERGFGRGEETRSGEMRSGERPGGGQPDGDRPAGTERPNDRGRSRPSPGEFRPNVERPRRFSTEVNPQLGRQGNVTPGGLEEEAPQPRGRRPENENRPSSPRQEAPPRRTPIERETPSEGETSGEREAPSRVPPSRPPTPAQEEPSRPALQTRKQFNDAINTILLEAAQQAADPERVRKIAGAFQSRDSFLTPLIQRMQERLAGRGRRDWAFEERLRNRGRQALQGRNRRSDFSLSLPEAPSSQTLSEAAGMARLIAAPIFLGLALVLLAPVWKRWRGRLVGLLGVATRPAKLPTRPVEKPRDLVRALDQFLVYQFGRMACWWHCRAVERALLTLAPEMSGDITRLVTTYELARYGPRSRPVPQEQLEQSAATLRRLVDQRRAADARPTPP